MGISMGVAAQTPEPPAGKGGHGVPVVIATADLAEFDALPEDRRKSIGIGLKVARDFPRLPYTLSSSDPSQGGFDCSGAMYLGTEKSDGRPVMINSTDGRSCRSAKASGYGVYDFRLQQAGAKVAFRGYGIPPGIGNQRAGGGCRPTICSVSTPGERSSIRHGPASGNGRSIDTVTSDGWRRTTVAVVWMPA